MTKQNAIKVFEEKKVRTVWDSDKEEWYFSIVDVIEILTEQPNHQGARHYWKVLKHRMSKEGNETVTNCNRLKLPAEDGKMRLTDVADTEQLFRKVFSDIGCYTLGANAPFNAIDSCVDMGASITMAKGASDAGVHPAVAVIGDSTFTHSGMTGLLDCVNENANVTIVISDNETTAMTGGQDSAGTGRLEAICAGIGVAPEHIRVVVPLKKNYEEMRQIIREEIEYRGVSVIIPRRECIQTLARKKRNK